MAKCFSAGFMEGPLGTAQDTSTPMDRQSEVVVQMTGGVFLNDKDTPAAACRARPTGSGVSVNFLFCDNLRVALQYIQLLSRDS